MLCGICRYFFNTFSQITIKWPDHRREERGINLVSYGDTSVGGYTAMAKCVGFPAGIGAKMVLDQEIQKEGMVYPFSQDIYKPMLMRCVPEIVI